MCKFYKVLASFNMVFQFNKYYWGVVLGLQFSPQMNGRRRSRNTSNVSRVIIGDAIFA